MSALCHKPTFASDICTLQAARIGLQYSTIKAQKKAETAPAPAASPAA
jgi:hypothetical protein